MYRDLTIELKFKTQPGKKETIRRGAEPRKMRKGVQTTD